MAAVEPISLAGCSGACEQGRIQCPHPDACEIPIEDDGPRMDRTGVFLLVMSIIGAWVAVLGIIQVARWLYSSATGA